MSEDRDEAIRRLLPLVRRIARRIARLVPNSDLDDLIGDGCVGLIRAVDQFDPSYGPPLEQFARRVAMGAMLNGIRRLDPVSERVRRVVRVAERERFALAVEHGVMPSATDMAARFPALRRARAEAYFGSPLSLDTPLPPEAGTAPLGAGDPAETVVTRMLHVQMNGALAALPVRERAVVEAHYFGERPLRELSDEMRVSPQRVSQLHMTAIERMRRTMSPA